MHFFLHQIQSITFSDKYSVSPQIVIRFKQPVAGSISSWSSNKAQWNVQNTQDFLLLIGSDADDQVVLKKYAEILQNAVEEVKALDEQEAAKAGTDNK